MRLRRAAGRLGRQRSRPFPLSPSPAFKLNQSAALATVSAVALAAPGPDMVVGAAISAPAMVVLQPRPFWYRVAGEFTRDGKPVNAPLRMMRLDRTLTITAYQVTAAGSFGANENGIFDLAGNVWEWTNTCFIHRTVKDADAGASTANCGVRVVEGRHRTYMTDFIRDPRTGGCAVGKPPSNLGFRLVRESALPPS